MKHPIPLERAKAADIDFSGNADMTGVICAARADLEMNESGHSLIDLAGALVVNSATLNGHNNLHFDEALKSHNYNTHRLVTAWNEI